MNRTFTVASAAAILVVVIAGSAPAAAATITRTASPTSVRVSVASPASLNLFVASGFRYQDPNPYACTATATMDMLNFIALGKSGGAGFRWGVKRTAVARDAILKWERAHDTLAGGNGSDAHGWRNALNYYGWGSVALTAGHRIYDDISYATYDGAVKGAVRAMIRFRKPVGVLAWAGAHAQMLVGYYGLNGDPFAKDALGKYTNAFTLEGFYLVDPLRSSGVVNYPISNDVFGASPNVKLRFRTYLETDSPYDDPYTAGYRASRLEWYGKFVIVAPIR